MPSFRLLHVCLRLACTALAMPATSLIAGKPTVVLASQTFVERVSTDANGKSRRILATARHITRGDRLIVVMHYKNDGSSPVDGFAITNPVPASVRIDLQDANMLVSVDHGRNWGRIDQLSVPTGLGGTRRATPDDVTHVRWAVPQPVRPGDTGQISYRAIVR